MSQASAGDLILLRLKRFYARFARECGPQLVCGGYEVREDGVVRRWDLVTGEFETKRHHP